MACASARGVAAELGETARVAVEQSVPALRLVRRIAHIGAIAIPEAMVAMRRARLAVPGPEIAARDRSAGPPRRLDPVLDHRVEAVAPGRRRAGGIGLAVAGEAEPLDRKSTRERGCQDGWISVCAVHIKKKKKNTQ